MASVRRLLNGATVETAKRKRICHHNRKKHSISAGEPCLVITDSSSGGKKNYCVECAAAILQCVDQDVAAMRKRLE
jgi:hypothetical protein